MIDIIECAEGPTPWASSIVLFLKSSKPNEIRTCVDVRSLDQSIIRERHAIPAIDDVVADLNGSKVFTKINQGYHQISLYSYSRKFTTFSTHELNVQKKVSYTVNGIPCVSDDGCGGTDTHDHNLQQVLRRPHENGMIINLPYSPSASSEFPLYCSMATCSPKRVCHLIRRRLRF